MASLKAISDDEQAAQALSQNQRRSFSSCNHASQQQRSNKGWQCQDILGSCKQGPCKENLRRGTPGLIQELSCDISRLTAHLCQCTC